MTATTIAASAGGVVEQVGSYAGYAAIIGLGVLSLLYFTQAREIKRLREWAGRAPERAAELEERVRADAQKRVVAQPIGPVSAAGQQAAEARTQAATAAVYASIGAQPPGAAPPPPGQLARPVPANPPAPGSAPASVPGSVPPAPGSVPPAPGAVPGAAPPAPGAPPSPAAPSPGTLPAAPTPAPAAAAPGATQTQTPSPAPAPATVSRPMVTATPTAPPAPSTPPPATAAVSIAAQSRTLPPLANGFTSQDTTESAAARPAPLPMPVPPRSPQLGGGDDDDGGFGLSPRRVGLIVGGGVAAIVVAVVLVLLLTGSDETAPPENNFGNTPSVDAPASGTQGGSGTAAGSGATASSATLTRAERRATNIAVLNGTTQTGLARAVANKIQEDGFTIGGVATNADQSVPTTIVSYTGDNEQAALAVARIIGIDRGSVQAADANTAAAASGDVIVTVGSDQIE